MYVVIIGPMGSGKTTFATKLHSLLPNFELLLNTEHEVFEWPCYLGKHADPEVAWRIQESMQENHFNQLFGTFLKDKNRNVISDSAFIEHRYYNDAKFMIGRYSQVTHDYLGRKHWELMKLLKKPDLIVSLD